MIKKLFFYLFILASITAAIWGYFKLQENKTPPVNVTEHIPSNAFCIIETSNLNELITQLTRQNLIWNSILNADLIKDTQKGIDYLDSLVKSHEELSEIIDGNKIYWSFIKDGNTFQSIIQFKVKQKNNETVFSDFFKTTFKKSNSVSSFDAYDFEINKQPWITCCKNGIIYLASDLSLLENCVDLNPKEAITNNPSYIELLKTNGNKNTQVYFNPLDVNLFDATLFTKPSYFNAEVKLNELTFNGYTVSDSLSFLSLLKHQEASSMHGFEKLPKDPSSIISLSISDAKLFYESFEKTNSTVVKQNTVAWDRLKDSALYNLKEEVLENIDGEIVNATYMINSIRSSITSLKIKDGTKANYFLSLMSDSVSVIQDLKIYKINPFYSNLFSISPGFLPSGYTVVSDNSLCFISDLSMLNYYTECLISNNSLERNSSFMLYAHHNLSQACHYFYYENTNKHKEYHLPSLLNIPKTISENSPVSQLSFTAKHLKSNLQLRINMMHANQQASSDSAEQTNSLWSFQSDAPIATQIFPFTNHVTNEQELCFQDNEKQLYLTNSTGKLIWKKKLSEMLQSQVYTVDLFKNGKFQLLFNSENYLHLIDRNGNYVQGFPVKLPAKVTSNITLIDYDHTKDYRLFIACADKKIYNYSLYGVKTEGFTPFKTEAGVTLPVYYAKIGLSDYLITGDVAGKIYAFSRKGEGRIDFKNKLPKHLSNLCVLSGNTINNSKLMYMDDETNSLNKLSLTDKQEVLKLGDELKEFHANFDFINDGAQPDLLAYGNGAIYAYDSFSSKLLESINEPAIYDDAQYISTTNHHWIIAFDNLAQKIVLVDKTGKIVSSILSVTQKPLISDLYKNGKTYLLLVNSNNIRCQEIN